MAYCPPLSRLLPLAGEYTIYRYISEYLSPQKYLSTLLVAVHASSLESCMSRMRSAI